MNTHTYTHTNKPNLSLLYLIHADWTNCPNDAALGLFMRPLKEKEENWIWHSHDSFIYKHIIPDVAGCGCVQYAQLQCFIFSTPWCINSTSILPQHANWLQSSCYSKRIWVWKQNTKSWPPAIVQHLLSKCQNIFHTRSHCKISKAERSSAWTRFFS